MKVHKMISIAKQFSDYPAGRDDGDGPDNGTRFRVEQLAPSLRQMIAEGAILEVSLDGVLSFGSSFLEEAFGGLIRREGFSKGEVRKHLRVVSSSPGRKRYLAAIDRYIDQA